MIKLLKVLLFTAIFLSGTFLYGCGAVNTASTEQSVCALEGESIICDKIPNVEFTGKVLLAANFAAIKKSAYTKEQALKVIGELEAVVTNGNISYNDLAMLIIERVASKNGINEDLDAIIFILDPNIKLFEGEVSILTPKDQAMLLAHLAKQKVLISLIN